jgi:hypothetical protein
MGEFIFTCLTGLSFALDSESASAKLNLLWRCGGRGTLKCSKSNNKMPLSRSCLSLGLQ